MNMYIQILKSVNTKIWNERHRLNKNKYIYIYIGNSCLIVIMWSVQYEDGPLMHRDFTHKGKMVLIQHYMYGMMFAKAGVWKVTVAYSYQILPPYYPRPTGLNHLAWWEMKLLFGASNSGEKAKNVPVKWYHTTSSIQEHIVKRFY